MTTLSSIQIAARFEPKLRTAVEAAFEAMRGRVTEKQIVDSLLSRGVPGVMSLLDGIEGDFGKVKQLVQDAYVQSGRMTIGVLPQGGVLDKTWDFNPFHPQTADHLRNYEMNLIREISTNTREAVRQGLQADIISGRNPVDTARTFRSNIGLTPRQEQAVRNYRNSLENLKTDSLKRALRDKRYDKTIQAAIDGKKPLSKEQIDQFVNRYRERYIKYRAETIARTESLRATAEGSRQAMKQSISDGAIDGERLRRHWVFTRDARTRSPHREIPGMNPKGVRFDEPYQSPLGPIMYPRDPNASAANTIDCRCRERYSFLPKEENMI